MGSHCAVLVLSVEGVSAAGLWGCAVEHLQVGWLSVACELRLNPCCLLPL